MRRLGAAFPAGLDVIRKSPDIVSAAQPLLFAVERRDIDHLVVERNVVGKCVVVELVVPQGLYEQDLKSP